MRTKVIVVTPLKLSGKDFDLLKKKVKSYLESVSLLGEETVFEEEVDPTILGGFKVKIGSVVFDLSLSGKIDKEIYGRN